VSDWSIAVRLRIFFFVGGLVVLVRPAVRVERSQFLQSSQYAFEASLLFEIPHIFVEELPLSICRDRHDCRQ
jgi:hypothetical protein